MSGRRYNIPGALNGLRRITRKPIERLKSLVALQPTKFPLPSASDVSSMFKMLDQAPLRPETFFIDAEGWKDIKAWTGNYFPRRPLPPIGTFSLIHAHKLELLQPGGELFFPRDVDLWVMSSALSLRPRIESYEDWRIRQAEEIVMGISEGNALEKYRDGQMGDDRRARGIALALNPNIRHVDIGRWQVPSHSDSKLCVVYDVDVNARTCTCLDQQKRKKKCKHIYAVEYLQSKTSMWHSMHTGVFMDSAAKQASFAATYGVSPIKLAALSGLKSGRFSTSKPNYPQLHSIPPPKLGPIDFAALETRIAAATGIPVDFIRGAKVSQQIHDEILIEVKVAPPTPTDAITLALGPTPANNPISVGLQAALGGKS